MTDERDFDQELADDLARDVATAALLARDAAARPQERT
jgi:hypothetical protein